MILYLDTSALVKLYAEEEYREEVERACSEAELITSSVLTYAEARAAFARKEREGGFSRDEHEEAVADLDSDVRDSYTLLPVEPEVIWRAGDLARKHGLRGYDAVHLASALALQEEAQRASRGQDPQRVVLLTFDGDLQDAAKQEEIT